MNDSNPLRAPPFFTIPGINPDDPISAQMEQIDQLNTLLLQDIDHNFAKFHQVVTSKLLPEIKRFALASEPTREASRFWRSFFEAAASVRVPIPGEVTTTEEDHSRVSAERYTDQETSIDGSISSEDRSFLYGNHAASSTPNDRNELGGGRNPNMSGATWASSIESPFEQLDRKLRDDLNLGRNGSLGGSGSSVGRSGPGIMSDIGDTTSSMGTPTPLPSGYGREDGTGTYDDLYEEPSVLIERREDSRNGPGSPYAQSDEEEGEQDGSVTPVAPRAAERHPASVPRQPTQSTRSPHASRNPFTTSSSKSNASSSSSASPWNGIVDMRNSPLNPKMRPSRHGHDNPSSRTHELNRSPPPLPYSFASPARNMQKTPGKDAARMIMDDMLKELGGLTASPGLPTPPAFSKYAALDTTPVRAAAAARRNLFDDDPHLEGSVAASGSSVHEGSSLARTVYTAGDQEEGDVTYRAGDRQEGDVSGSQIGRNRHYGMLEGDGDESFDTEAGVPEGYDDDGAAPLQSATSAAGAARRNTPRDSFGNETSLDTIQPGKYRQAHESIAEKTWDSMSPATSEAARVFGGPAGAKTRGKNLFSLHGPDEIHTFHGGRLEDGVSSPKDSPSYGYGLARMQSRGGGKM